MKRSSEADNAPLEAVVNLARSYEQIKEAPAWADLWGRIFLLQQALAEDIVVGTYDKWGRDQTPGQRLAYAVLEEIIAIPGNAQFRSRAAQEQIAVMESLTADLTTPN